MAGAIVMPGADLHQLGGKSHSALDVWWLTIHTMVGTLEGTHSWFDAPGRPYSHLGLAGDAYTRQWQDMRYRAASDLDANGHSVSWECEDSGPGFPRWDHNDPSQVPAFTDEQADALIVQLSWGCHRFRLPRSAIRTTCPHERGIAWHRLGIDPWRAPGCLKTSSSRGKRCPGDKRIAQLENEIIRQVSAPGAPPLGGFLMALSDHDQQRLLDSQLRTEHALNQFLGGEGKYLGGHETARPVKVTAQEILDTARRHGYFAKLRGAAGGASLWVPADHSREGVVVLTRELRSWIETLNALAGLDTKPVELDPEVYEELEP